MKKANGHKSAKVEVFPVNPSVRSIFSLMRESERITNLLEALVDRLEDFDGEGAVETSLAKTARDYMEDVLGTLLEHPLMWQETEDAAVLLRDLADAHLKRRNAKIETEDRTRRARESRALAKVAKSTKAVLS
jgi:uncharacterized membrane-anchored protein YjiN (DUF445 family)